MANLQETSTWETGIYQLETTDPVEAGENGIDNLQAKQLANRTLYLYDNTWRTGDMKMVTCTNAYITANFDATGLGKNERLGWKICNGNNATIDMRKRVPIGYDHTTYVSGFNYSQMGNSFGEEKHVITKNELPSSIDFDGSASGDAGGGVLVTGNSDEGSITIATGGQDLGHNNIQPSLVVLFIQKI
jgi:hypothetical protein